MSADPLVHPAGVVCIKCGYDLRGLPWGGVCPECGTPIEDSLPDVRPGVPRIPTGIRCVRCRGDLGAQPMDGVCPECGTPNMQSLIDEPPSRGDASELVAGIVCIGCGYDLRGLPRGNACPECGTSTRQQLPTGAVCIKCGYDLRALPPGGKCPECGTPTRRSPGGDPLASADPQWIRRLALGQELLAWGLVLTAVSTLACTCASIMDSPIPRVGAAGFLVAGMLTCLVGAFLLTTREPRKRRGGTRSASRLVARLALVAAVGGVSVSPALPLLLLAPATLARSRIGLYVLSATALFVAILALLGYLSGLAWRVPDLKLARRTDNARWTLGLVIPALVVIGAVLLPLVRQPIANEDLLGVILGGAGLGCAGLTIALLLTLQIARLFGLMHVYRRAFRRCCDKAPT